MLHHQLLAIEVHLHATILAKLCERTRTIGEGILLQRRHSSIVAPTQAGKLLVVEDGTPHCDCHY